MSRTITKKELERVRQIREAGGPVWEALAAKCRHEQRIAAAIIHEYGDPAEWPEVVAALERLKPPQTEAGDEDHHRTGLYAVFLCDACIDGVGEECHTPACVLCRHKVDLPIMRELLVPIAQTSATPTTYAEARPPKGREQFTNESKEKK